MANAAKTNSRVSVPAPPRGEARVHIWSLCLAPLVLYFINSNWPFQGLGHMDNWYYAGFFTHDLGYQPEMSNYAGERLSWNIPGHLLTMLFGAPNGGLMLNFICHALGCVLVHLIVRRFADSRSAFLTAALMAAHPLYIGANGWNYLNGGSNVYLLATYWALAASHGSKHERWLLIAAGASWAALINGYIAWLIFTPACVLYWLAGTGKPVRALLDFDVLRSLLRAAAFCLLGFIGMTAAFAIIHTALAQNQNRYFLYHTLYWTFAIGNLKSNPWTQESFNWLRDATWIVTPLVAAVFTVAALVTRRLTPAARALLASYLYSFGVMAFFEFRPNKLMEFDYFVSILLPGAFLALGVTVFRVPRELAPKPAIALAIVASLLTAAALFRPGLYLVGLGRGIVWPLIFSLVAVAIWFVPGRRAVLASTALFAIGSFALVPFYTSRAYRERYDGKQAYTRVADAVRAVDQRHKADGRNQAPLFWFDNANDPYTTEFRAIMCGFMSHKISMQAYPEVDTERVKMLRDGDLLTVLTRKQVFAGELTTRLARFGIQLSEDGSKKLLVFADSSSVDGYQITFFRVRVKS